MTLGARLRRLAGGKALRGGSALAVSSAAAQGIALMITPALSRIYGPEAFGYLTLVVSVTGALTPAVALRFESALLLPDRRETASALLCAGVASAVAISLLAVGMLEILFAMGLLRAMAEMEGFSLWVGGISLLSGLFILFGQYALRQQRFVAVALRNMTQAIVTAVAQLLLGLGSATALGLVGGYAAGRVVGVVPLVAAVRSELVRFRWADVVAAVREYRVFPLLFAPAAVLNAAALSLPVICAGLWFDVGSAGQWGMAERVLALPLVVVAASVGQVVESELALMRRTARTGSAAYYLKASGALLGFGFLVGAVVLFAAPAVVPYVLGDGWADAAVIMQLLIPMLVARLVSSPMSKVLVIAKWGRANLLLDAGRFVLVIGVLIACRHLGASLHAVVIWTSLAFVLVYVVTWIGGYIAAKQLDERTVKLSAAG